MKSLFFKPISDRALSYFYRQMSTMEDSGITPAAALDTVEEQFKSVEFRGVLGQLKRAAESGNSLSEEMEKYPDIFSPIQCSLVKAGETGGSLGESFRRIADHLEGSAQIRERIVLALLYPGIILHVGALLLALVEFMGPEGGLGAAFLSLLLNLGILYVVVIVIAGVHGRFQSSPKWEQLLLRIPWIGPLRKKLALMRFTRTLSSLMEAGVDVTLAVELGGEASANPVIRKVGLKAAELVDGGRGLADAFVASLIFPSTVLQMIDVGEKSGRLPETLAKTSQILEDEANHQLGVVVRILPVVASLLVFGFLALKIIAFWLGYYGGM